MLSLTKRFNVYRFLLVFYGASAALLAIGCSHPLIDDAHLKNHLISDFYQYLEESRGKRVEIRVVSGGDGPPLTERPARIITFAMPLKGKTPVL